MNVLFDLLRDNPVIPIFLTLGVGFWLGNLRIGSFSLGPVTATLLVGVLIGQIGVPVSDTLKTVAFVLFLFAIGYNVGPQFFRSLKGEGLRQIGFALMEGSLCIGVCILAARIMGWDKGMALGLFAGSQTVSATIGVGFDTLKALGVPEEQMKHYHSVIPAAYAVTYVFGTIGSAWVIANLGPYLLGGIKKVRKQTALLEEEMDTGDFTAEPGMMVANRPVCFRAYKVEGDYFRHGRTVAEIERRLSKTGYRHYVQRIRMSDAILDAKPERIVRRGDTIVLSGHRESMVMQSAWIGTEVTDHELLNFSTENLPVTVSKSCAGITLGELRGKPWMKGVHIKKVLRSELPLPRKMATRLERGDVVTLIGLPEDVANAVPEIGFADRNSGITDVVFLSLGIAIGCLIGALSLIVDGIPLTLSISGGTIIAGLVMGWWRSRRPDVGHIPRSVIWFCDQVGLNLFIACVGLGAGPSFIDGLKAIGLPMFFMGILCTSIPLILSIIIGGRIFRFPPAVTLGCAAGARNAVAALGAIQDSVGSSIPMLGYTVTYAVSSVFLIFAGLIIPLLI